MRTLEELEADLIYYQEIYIRARKERRFRMAEGAQWNIDRTQDKIRELKNVPLQQR